MSTIQPPRTSNRFFTLLPHRALLLVMVSLCASAAQAQPSANPDADPEPGPSVRPYVLASVGGTAVIPTDVGGRGAFQDGNVSFGYGWETAGSLGLQLPRGWSVELELAYRTAAVTGGTLPGLGAVRSSDLASLTFGLNALRDVFVTPSGNFSIALGGGLTWLQEVDMDLNLSESSGEARNFQAAGLGVQGLVRLNYYPTDRLFVSATFRYLGAFDIDLKSREFDGALDLSYSPVSALIGVGVRL